jgi:uncharacterized protein (DUF58 family)
MAISPNFIDPKLLASVDDLALRARFAVEGFLGGLHRSPQRGFSVEFTDHRTYCQGDDTRYIDWKLYGRSDKLYIKQFEDETNARCMILLDTSASMAYASGTVSKLEYSRTLAAALAYLMMRQRDAVGLMTFSDSVNHTLPARYRQGHLLQILRTLAHVKASQATDTVRPLRELMPHLRRRGFVIVISDLLEGEKQSLPVLQHLRTIGHEVIVFHVMDPDELHFPFREASEFVDLESGESLFAAPGAIRERYLQAVADYTGFCRKQCQSHGVDYCLMNTGEVLDKALATYLTRRGRRC